MASLPSWYSLGNPLLPELSLPQTSTDRDPFRGTWPSVGSRLDLLSQKPAFGTAAGNILRDEDGVQRAGDAIAGPGYPMLKGSTAARPLILNRPFRSVGELGYVFRDMPWKTLDLNSANSADAALLDAFSVEDSKLVAGRIDLNTRNKQVLAALLSGTLSQETGGTTLSATDAETVAEAIVAASSVQPFRNPAELVTRTQQIPSAANKMNQETVARALGSSVSTRTWNLLIDLVAQTGVCPRGTSGTNLGRFLVNGEKRFWLHVALDRHTGQVIDRQLEVVDE